MRRLESLSNGMDAPDRKVEPAGPASEAPYGVTHSPKSGAIRLVPPHTRIQLRA